MFNNVYHGKKVLITGHTGFKGTWLTTWLLKLGAYVVGVSKNIPTNPSMFEILNLSEKINHISLDISQYENIKEVILKEKPDFVFHLAAQAIVSISYNNPLETITSNVIGTSNLLEGLKISNHKCTAIIITSDKAYDNVEKNWGYKEKDQLGGKDIYSGSKGAAELIIKSYFHSFFKLKKSKIHLAVARAGNVIGGGDWAKDRLVVDAVSSWSKNNILKIRSPNATRPWQHVLEPLSGYLNLGMRLYYNHNLNGEAFNFGPSSEQNISVHDLLSEMSKYWGYSNINDALTIDNENSFYEATLLELNCEKAFNLLKWQSVLDYKNTIKLTSEWYRSYYKNNKKMDTFTLKQILEYENLATQQSLVWTE